MTNTETTENKDNIKVHTLVTGGFDKLTINETTKTAVLNATIVQTEKPWGYECIRNLWMFVTNISASRSRYSYDYSIDFIGCLMFNIFNSQYNWRIELTGNHKTISESGVSAKGVTNFCTIANFSTCNYELVKNHEDALAFENKSNKENVYTASVSNLTKIRAYCGIPGLDDLHHAEIVATPDSEKGWGIVNIEVTVRNREVFNSVFSGDSSYSFLPLKAGPPRLLNNLYILKDLEDLVKVAVFNRLDLDPTNHQVRACKVNIEKTGFCGITLSYNKSSIDVVKFNDLEYTYRMLRDVIENNSKKDDHN